MKRKFKITAIAALLFFITVTSNTILVFADPDKMSLDHAIQTVQECDSKIESNIENLNNLEEQIIEKEKEIENNKEKLRLAQEKVDKREEQLGRRLNAIQLGGGYEGTTMQYIDVLFSSGNILDALQKVSQITQICSCDKNLILEAKEAKGKLLDVKDNIDKEYNALEKSKEDIENKNKELQVQKERLLRYIQENQELFRSDIAITVPVTLPSDITGKTKALIEEAEKYLKVPYLWGGESPDGFDCSGFTKYVFKSQGVDLPRISEEQQQLSTSIDMKDIKPGDLVFNKPSNSTHVGIYIGNDMYIQAPHTGDVVKISRLSNSNMKYVGRVID